MSLFNNPGDVLKLQKLLNPVEEENSDSDNEVPIENNVRASAYWNAGARGDAAKGTSTTKLQPKPCVKDDQPKNLEEWFQREEQENSDLLETRKRPEYTVSYRQAVGVNDVFLHLGNRNSSSASCEDMILEVFLPNELTPFDKWTLKVTEAEIDLGTALYRMKLPLSQKVNPDCSHAKYDVDGQKLILQLRMKRELDFVNF